MTCNIWVYVIQLTHFSCDDCENACTWSYHHHQIGCMNHLPLFKFRWWNNGMCCMSFYILMGTFSTLRTLCDSNPSFKDGLHWQRASCAEFWFTVFCNSITGPIADNLGLHDARMWRNRNEKSSWHQVVLLAEVIMYICVPGLFHQVIAQSGTDLGAWATNSMGQDPKGYAKQVGLSETWWRHDMDPVTDT